MITRASTLFYYIFVISFIDESKMFYKELSTILIVDDDPTTQLLIAEILKTVNVIILECGCGKEAISLFEKHGNDIILVLLDRKLPDGNGWDLLDEFRRIKPTIAVIAMTALPAREAEDNCRKSGFNGCISKPFRIKELMEIVVGYL